MEYDSTADTLKHIKRVNELLGLAASELIRRGSIHDDSKLIPPEKEAFDIMTPRLKTLVYGTDEYQQSLAEMKTAIDHHQQNNSHHPEFYPDGVDGMDLFDLLEMFFDWKAASERHETGDILKSIMLNEDRFRLSPQVASIMRNTVQRYLQDKGW